MKTTTLNSRLLAIIGRRMPAIYDAVIPRYYSSLGLAFGPHPEPWKDRLSAVALNPQPLPPHELGAAIAVEFLRATWLADRFGQGLGRLADDLDDWCPTRPKKPKLPPWWPPVPDPEPHPDWFIDFHLGFAARLAAAPLESTRIAKSINKAIERSMTAINSAPARG